MEDEMNFNRMNNENNNEMNNEYENNVVEGSEELEESDEEEEVLISSSYIKEKIEEVVDKYIKINPSLEETLKLLKQDLIREIEIIEEHYDEFEDEDFDEEDEE